MLMKEAGLFSGDTGKPEDQNTPESVTKVHQAIWRARGEIVGAVYEVPPCPYTQEELAALERQDKRVGYLPEELATQQSRHLLGRMFPRRESYAVREDNPVSNEKSPFGWFDYDAGIDAPYLNTTEEQLTKILANDRRELLSLNQYIVASQDSKLFTGYYLDGVETWTRLGSRDEGWLIYAGFPLYYDGYLVVDSTSPGSEEHRPDLGGRSFSYPPVPLR